MFIYVGVLVTIEKDLLISLLKLTKDEEILIECIKRDTKISYKIVRKMLKQLQSEGLIHLKNDFVETESASRLKLAVKAVSLGVDVETVSTFLRWQEFEEIAAIALERNGYATYKNVRFKHVGHRYEIDIIGCRKPLVLCVDCKRWQRGVKPSSLKRIVKAQVERVGALVDMLPNPKLKVECVKWNKAKFIPMILAFIPSSSKFYENVPVVPVLQLQDFLRQLPAYVESLMYFKNDFSHL